MSPSKSKASTRIDLEVLFRENLVRRREAADGGIGLSQAQLAARAGFTAAYISLLERGLRSPPLETVQRLAGAMGIDPRSFFRKGRES